MDERAGGGRRERHKLATRQALTTAAGRLFRSQGFGATTVHQIAEAAHVSERTFFRYFESKEDLLLTDLRQLLQAVERELATRPLAEAPLTALQTAWRTAVLAAASQRLPLLAPDLDPVSAPVPARLVLLFTQWEDHLSQILLARFAARGADPARFEVRLRAGVVARAGAAAIRGALQTWRAGGGELHPVAVDQLFRDAFAILADGCPPPGGEPPSPPGSDAGRP